MQNKFSSDWIDGFRARVLESYECEKIRDLEAKTSIAYQTLYGYLTGKRDTPNELLLRFGKDTGVSIHWLLTGDGEKFVGIGANADVGERLTRIESLFAVLADEMKHLRQVQGTVKAQISQPIDADLIERRQTKKQKA